MRRFTSVFGLLIAALCIPLAIAAQGRELFTSEQTPQPKQQTAMPALSADGNTLHLLAPAALKAENRLPATKRIRKARRTKAIESATDLVGNYVMTYNSLTASGNDGGNAVNITRVLPGTDSISINNFWSTGTAVHAKYDATTRKITIPNQVIGSNTTYGKYDIAVMLSTGKPDRTTEITGSVDENGNITIDSWWGVFVMSGDNADKYFNANYNTSLVKSNATMSYTLYTSKTATTSEGSYAVYVEQPSTNVLKVLNFANYGQEVEFALNRDYSATIAQQVARKDATNGDWKTVCPTYKDDLSGLTGYTAVITCDKATDKRTISWGNWTLLTTGYYLGAFTSGKITTDADITYPSISVTDWEGEGTQDNPYKIKQLDDLILLADKVNGNTEYNYGTTTPYARVFLDKHFRMENDIDMSGYRFDPIGNSWTQRFAGEFDGNGHTISNLTVNTGAKGYAGLFGFTDTLCVIKNVKFDKAVIESANYYAAVANAVSLGEISNVTVTNSTVTNTGNTGAGGVAAIANKVSDCHVSASNITGQYGYAGGVAGQVNTYIKNSSAVNVMIKAGGISDTYPSGGVVGSLYFGKAEDCYFSGTLDGRYHSNLSLGGVAGVCYKGSITRCFATGTIYGYDNTAYVGGVAGNIYGDITDCYNTASISSASSRYAAGLVGYVRNYTDDNGATVESTITNCYTAAPVQAETYLYDTATERREIIGKIADGAKPTFTNIYYDKQVVNFKSEEYGATTEFLTAADGIKGFDPSVWTFVEGTYPRLTASANTEAACLSASAVVLHKDSSLAKVARDGKVNTLGNTITKYYVDGNVADAGRYSTIEAGTLKLKEEFGSDTIFFVNTGVGARMLTMKISPVPFDGDGSEANPYLLKTKDDLITLSKVTTVSEQFFPDTYFKIVNDIDLEKDTNFLGICTSITTGSGDAHNQFVGHIDGDGHTIHNMVIPGAMSWTTEPTETAQGTPNTKACLAYKGFIGRLGAAGSLKNLTIAADCDLNSFWATSSALVAYNYGLVENCKNYADVTGYSCWIGGIVGQNVSGAVIRNCYNEGTITTGYMNAGGIAGSNYGLIENCENAGTVQAKQISTFIDATERTKMNSIGGISGTITGGRNSNCVNSGTISGYGRVGGISGSYTESSSSTYTYANDAINCINYGTIIADSKLEAGSIGGKSGTKGVTTDNYYDGQITVYKANGGSALNGTQAIETSQLTSGNALENFSTDIWSFEAGKYPVLKQFAGEKAAGITRRIIANIATGETALALTSDITLGEGTWRLAKGDAFKIEGSKVITPQNVQALVVDTLYATLDGIEKPFVIEARPAIPLSGSGTASDPYIIGNTTDWNAIADYMAVCAEPMDGCVLKLSSDITFTDTTIKPFSYDGVTNFNGELDGDGHTVTATAAAAADGEALVIRATGTDAYIHDLIVDGEFTSAKYTKVAAVVGTLNGTLENVTNKAKVTGTSKSYVAGVAGTVGSTATLIKCINRGEISSANTYVAGLASYSLEGAVYKECGNEGKISFTGTNTSTTPKKAYVAGLVAYTYPGTYTDCYNSGNLEVSSTASIGTVSGLIGMAYATDSSQPFYITRCYNTASVTSAANNAGLIVDVDSKGAAQFVMEDCWNSGDISSLSEKTVSSTYTAGIATLYTAKSVYRGCYNTGTILSQKPVYAAGIACYYKGTQTADTKSRVVGCWNSGNIIATGNQGGGIIAYLTNYMDVDSCYNVGDIEGGFGLGGIVAAVPGKNSTVSNCWNEGSITTSTYRAGGIIGYNAGNGATIDNCCNFGDVSSTATKSGTTTTSAYGIGGIAGQGAGHYTNVYNTGEIKGLSQVGGIIGYTSKGTADGLGTTVENAYNFGEIDAPADTCASIVGVHTDANGKLWNEYNYVKNAYFVTETAPESPANALGTSTALAKMSDINLGDNWMTYDKYCMPVLKSMSDNAFVRVNAIKVILGDGDTYENITKDFYVGRPEGVTFSCSVADVEISGNTVHFTKPYTGELTIKAAAEFGEGDNSITATTEIILNCVVTEVSGINDVNASAKKVVKEVFYNAAGVEVAQPANDGTGFYIVVKTYDDGTTQTVKEVR